MTKRKRLDEEFAREAVTRFLCPPFERSDLIWEPHEAPDWILKAAGRPLGIEVTWVSGMTNLGGKLVPNRQIGASLADWVETLRQEIEAAPWFSGLYVISMQPIPNLRAETQELREQIVAYVKETQNCPKATPKRLPGGWKVGKFCGSTTMLLYS